MNIKIITTNQCYILKIERKMTQYYSVLYPMLIPLTFSAVSGDGCSYSPTGLTAGREAMVMEESLPQGWVMTGTTRANRGL